VARTLFIGALCILLSCNSKPAPPRNDMHVTAATLLTERYETSPFAAWHVRATAAGSDCSALVLQTGIILEDSMIETMHYGAGAYNNIIPGGVKKFLTDYAFRGVIYEDVSGRKWTYGVVTEREKEEVTRCQ